MWSMSTYDLHFSEITDFGDLDGISQKSDAYNIIKLIQTHTTVLSSAQKRLKTIIAVFYDFGGPQSRSGAPE